MAATAGAIKVSVFDGSRQLRSGPQVRLKLTDPFTSSSNKTVADETMKKGVNTISLTEVPADVGQRFILMVDAEKPQSFGLPGEAEAWRSGAG